MSESSALKVAVVGAGGVGKSCITIRFVQSKFIKKYSPTIEDFYRKAISLDDNNVYTLDIMDTAGQEEFSALRESYMRSGQGFLLVYAVNSRTSFEECKNLRNQILRARDKDADKVPIVLLGNKCDMPAEDREVTAEEGKALAQEFGCIFFETSAKENINVTEAFTSVTRKIVEIQNSDEGKKKEKQGKSKRCVLF